MWWAVITLTTVSMPMPSLSDCGRSVRAPKAPGLTEVIDKNVMRFSD